MIFGSKLQAGRHAFEQATSHGDPSRMFFSTNSHYLEPEQASRLAQLRAELMLDHGRRIEKIHRLHEIASSFREKLQSAYASRNALIKRRKEYESAAYRASEIGDKKTVIAIESEIRRTKEMIAVVTGQIANLEHDFQSSLSVADACSRVFALSINGNLMYRGELLSSVLGFDIH